jgi:hypothetical protein
VQRLVRACRGACVSGRLVLPWLVRPTASSLWLCCTAQHSYPHRHDSPQPPGSWPAWATGMEPTPLVRPVLPPIACWIPPGSWPNAHPLMWFGSQHHPESWWQRLSPSSGGQSRA